MVQVRCIISIYFSVSNMKQRAKISTVIVVTYPGVCFETVIYCDGLHFVQGSQDCVSSAVEGILCAPFEQGFMRTRFIYTPPVDEFVTLTQGYLTLALSRGREQ